MQTWLADKNEDRVLGNMELLSDLAGNAFSAHAASYSLLMLLSVLVTQCEF